MSASDDLRGFQPRHAFFIGVDSDGCVFDSMGAKHLHAFIPAAIATWRLDAIATAFTEAQLEINLRSAQRGINRFAGLLLTFERLAQRVEITGGGATLPDLAEMRAFVCSGLTQSNDGLREFIRRRPSRSAFQLLEWSLAADAAFAAAAETARVFPGAAEALEQASARAHLMIVSAASGPGLRRDWERAGLLRFVDLVAGQEAGDKAAQLARAIEGRYGPGRVLLIGDAPGDLAAARRNGALFHPIVPGKETESWRLFREDTLDRFTAGCYAGKPEAGAIATFCHALGMSAE